MTNSENYKKAEKAITEFFDQGGKEFLEQFETSLDCASVCETPLFYVSRPVSDGPPTRDCFEPLIEKLDQPVFCVVTLLTGLICIGAMIMAIPLICGFSGKDDMMGSP